MTTSNDRVALRVLNLERQFRKLVNTPQLGHSSIEDGSLDEYDENGNLVSIIGKQPDGTHGAVVVSGPPPPQPSAPVCTPGPGLLEIGWDGNFADGNGTTDIRIPAPMDFARVEIHLSPERGFQALTTATLVATLESPRGGSYTVMREVGTYYAVLVARSHSGKASVQSAQVTTEVLPPVGSDVDVDALRTEFQEADAALNRALTQNQQSQLDMGAELGTLRDTTLPALDTRLKAAQTGLDTLKNTTLPALDEELARAQGRIDTVAGQVSPLEAGLAALNRDTIPALQASIDGKTQIVRMNRDPADSDAYPAGTRWERWSTLGTGGKLQGTWRRTNNGTWLQEALDPAYIPLLDLGQGTYGELDGGRLKARTVLADQLLVGIGGNLFADADMLDTSATGWQRPSTVTMGGAGTGKTGRGSMLISGVSTQAGSYYGISAPAKRTPVTPGGSYAISVWVRGDTALPVRAVSLYARGYLPDGSFVWGDIQAVSNATELPANVWHRLAGKVTFPDTVTTMTLGCYTQAVYSGAARFSDPAIQMATTGELIVNGSIIGDHVQGESVAAKVSAFVEADIGKLTVTGETNLNTAVAKRIGANVGEFIELGVEQLTVTGTAGFKEAVAKRIGADAGRFIELGVEQLVVTGTASLSAAVAEHIAARSGQYVKLGANQVFVGAPGNMFPDPNMENAAPWNGSGYSSTQGYGGGGSMLVPASTSQIIRWYGTDDPKRYGMPVNEGDKLKLSCWARGSSVPVNQARMYLRSYDATGAQLGTSVWVGNSSVLANNVYGEISGEVTMPKGAKYAILGFVVNTNTNVSVRFSDPVVKLAVTPSLIVDGFFQGLRVIGASIETNAALLRGVKLNDAGLWAWDGSGNETFRLEAGTGNLRAVGNFETTDGSTLARLGVYSNAGRTRPMVSFTGTGTGQVQPSIFAEGNASGGYGQGSLVAHGRERTTNSSGRSTMHLQADGAGGKLMTEYGPNNNTGFHWEGGLATVRGKLGGWEGSAQDQFRSGASTSTTVPANNAVTWGYTHAAPPPDGVIRVFATPDNATSNAISASVNNVSRTGFVLRVTNGSNIPTYVGSVYWFGVWIA